MAARLKNRPNQTGLVKQVLLHRAYHTGLITQALSQMLSHKYLITKAARQILGKFMVFPLKPAKRPGRAKRR